MGLVGGVKGEHGRIDAGRFLSVTRRDVANVCTAVLACFVAILKNGLVRVVKSLK